MHRIEILGKSYSKYDTFAFMGAGRGEVPAFELLHFHRLSLLLARFPNSTFFSFLEKTAVFVVPYLSMLFLFR